MFIKFHNYDSREAYPLFSKGVFEMSEIGEINDDTEFFDEKGKKIAICECVHQGDFVLIDFLDCEGDYIQMKIDIVRKTWEII